MPDKAFLAVLLLLWLVAITVRLCTVVRTVKQFILIRRTKFESLSKMILIPALLYTFSPDDELPYLLHHDKAFLVVLLLLWLAAITVRSCTVVRTVKQFILIRRTKFESLL